MAPSEQPGQQLGDATADHGVSQESEDEAEEQPPRLKYQRVGASVAELLRSDTALCLAAHPRFLVLGTAAGAVCVLDFNGDAIKLFDAHAGPVRDVAVEAGGEHVASCGDDGRVMVHGMYGDTDNVRVTYPYAVQSVALDPGYERRRTRALACAGVAGQLVMNVKGFFGRKDSLLFDGTNAIQCVRWRGNLVAWASQHSVHVYDTALARRISYVERPRDSRLSAPVPAMPPSLVWESNTSLLIAWADAVMVAQVRDATPAAILTGSPPRVVEIQAVIRTDFIVAGVAPFQEHLVVLAYMYEDQDQDQDRDEAATQRVPARPELRVWQRSPPYTEVACDALGIRRYQEYSCEQYRLVHMPDVDDTDGALFYVVAPRDIVLARATGPDDQIDWLLTRQRFEDALLVAERCRGDLRRASVVGVGEQYLDALVDSGALDQAASLLPRVCRASRELWERWIRVFAKLDGALLLICWHIPSADPQLSQETYTLVLQQMIETAPDTLVQLLRQWPHYLYDVASLAELVLRASQTQGNPVLLDALALLYSYSKQEDKALHIYLRLQRPAVFDLIHHHDLLASVADHSAALMRIDPAQATPLLVQHPDLFPVAHVVRQLQAMHASDAGPSPKMLLHQYLDALFDDDTTLGRDFHSLQVELYARYDYPKLRSFLERSNFVPLREAYQVCQRFQLYPEMVYLLDRMGSARDALRLIVDKLRDVKAAIEFVHTHQDDDLWQDLMAHAMKSPDFVAELLDNLGSDVNPLQVVKRIPPGMRIPNLRNRIISVLSDCQLEISLRAGCNRVLAADAGALGRAQNAAQRRAVRLASEAVCSLCSRPVCMPESLLEDSMASKMTMVVFFCAHTFHERCLRASYQNAVSPYQHGLTSSSISLQQRDAVSSPVPGHKSAAATPAASTATSPALGAGLVRHLSAASLDSPRTSTASLDAAGSSVASKHKLWCPLCHAHDTSATQSFSWRRGIATPESP